MFFCHDIDDVSVWYLYGCMMFCLSDRPYVILPVNHAGGANYFTWDLVRDLTSGVKKCEIFSDKTIGSTEKYVNYLIVIKDCFDFFCLASQIRF